MFWMEIRPPLTVTPSSGLVGTGRFDEVVIISRVSSALWPEQKKWCARGWKGRRERKHASCALPPTLTSCAYDLRMDFPGRRSFAMFRSVSLFHL